MVIQGQQTKLFKELMVAANAEEEQVCKTWFYWTIFSYSTKYLALMHET